MVNWETAIAEYDRDLRARGVGGADAAGVRGRSGRFRRVGRRRRGWVRATFATATCGATRPGCRPRVRLPATVARKLAAIRGLYGFLVRTERAGQNPAELVSSPKRAEKLPKVLSTEQMRARCWSGSRPARRCSCATGRCWSWPTPAACAARRSSTSTRRARLRDRAAAGARQGLQGADPAGRRAGAEGSAPLHGARPARARHRSARAGALPLQERPPPLQLRRHPPPRPLDARGGARRRGLAAFTSTFLRDPSARKVAPICVPSRSCWDTRRSRPPRSTPESMPPACVTPMPPATPAHDADPTHRT